MAAVDAAGALLYVAKIAKYVPAEVVAISVAGFAAFDPRGNWIYFWILVGIAANLLYLFANAVRLPIPSRPRAYFYVLSIVAFLAWAAATIPQVRDKFGLGGVGGDEKAAYVLALAAFVLPALDTAAGSFNLQR